MAREIDLLGYWMPVLRQLKEFKEIAKAETPELKYILEQIERTLNNMFIETADEYGIKRFEDMMGIYPEAGASLETRRFNVLVKWNDKVPYTEKELYNRLISICGDDNFSVNPDYKNYFVEIITHLGIEGAFDTISSILQDMIPCNLVLDLKNTLEEGNTTPFSVAVVSCVAMRYQITNDINPKVATKSPMYYGVGLGRAGTHIITHDIKSTVNQSSDLSVAQALSTGGSSGAITMDIAVKDEVESPHYEGVGVGMAFTKIITHDINSKATNSGNTTVASPVIPNRGIQPIINQLRGYKKKIKKNGKVVAEKWIPSILVSDPEATKYCLKLDVRKYYPSIVHDVLKAKYRELFKDEELIWLMDEIIDSISTCPATEENIEILQRLGVAVNIIIDDNGREFVDGVGIPIGNYVSQYDGNFNLSVVDHWLKEVKGVKYYFRYMDDMVIFGSSKEELHKLKRELDEFMAVNLKQVLKHNWQVFPTKVRGVDFVGYRFFGEYTLLRKSTCKTFKRRMLSISSKRENNVSPTYSEWCSFNSYVGWLQHCDSFRLYQKYVEPNVEYMHNYYLKEVKGNAEICKRKNYSGERKAS